jgi:hypothetical protein
VQDIGLLPVSADAAEGFYRLVDVGALLSEPDRVRAAVAPCGVAMSATLPSNCIAMVAPIADWRKNGETEHLSISLR